MSGCAFNKTWNVIPQRNYAERLAKLLGYTGSESAKDVLEFLENADIWQVVASSFATGSDEEKFGENIMITFGPTIEPYISENCFIPKDPILMAREAWSNDIDCIFTGDSFEGILMSVYAKDCWVKPLQNYNYFAPIIELGIDVNSEKAEKYGKIIKEIYFGDKVPSMENHENYLHVRLYNLIQTKF